MRRLPTVGFVAMIVGLVLLVVSPALAPGAAAQAPQSPLDTAVDGTGIGEETVEGGIVDVVKVDGLLDPVMADFVKRSVADATRSGATALVLQVDSSGSVLSDAELAEVVAVVARAAVPVSVWVGPSGSSLLGSVAVLGGHADAFGMAPGTRWGLNGVTPPAGTLEGIVRALPEDTVTAEEAAASGAGVMAPTIGDLIVDLPGVLTREVLVDGEPRREPITTVRFSQLPLLESLLHAVASPAVAYLLLTVGMALLLFELFTAGVGVAGGVAAGSLILGCYGLAWLPVRWWAVALLVVAMVAFAIDVQTGVPRVWTGIGMVLFVLGSLWLYDGVGMSWITLGVAFIGVALTFYSGIPSMVRTRFATPTIGREWMVGEMGRAVTAVAPDGVVQVRGAQWRATTNRATPIDELDAVRVVGIDGLVLEVEPEEGGARDYRERARGGKAPDAAAPDADDQDGGDEAERPSGH